MRMRELAERSRLPRTTIHHYLREGLLPAPRKRSRNSAEYGEAHLARLRLVAALRSEELGPLPLDGVRSVLALVDRGVEPAAAVGLFRAMGGAAAADAELGLPEAARRAGVEPRRLRDWTAAGLLAPGGAGYDGADVAMARLYDELFEASALEVDDLRPVAALLREAAAYGRTLAEVAARSRPPAAPARGGDAAHGERAARLVGRALDALYRYLRAREAGPGAA